MLYQNRIVLSSLAFSLAYHFTLGGIVEWAEENHETLFLFRSAVELSTSRANLLDSVYYRNVYLLWKNEIVSPSPSVPLVDIPQKRNPHFNINLWRIFPWRKPTRFCATRCFFWNGYNLSGGAYLNECFVCNVLLNYFLILWFFFFFFCDKSGSRVRVYLIQDLHFAVIMEFDASHILFIIHC
jgi:hypothetical protein